MTDERVGQYETLVVILADVDTVSDRIAEEVTGALLLGNGVELVEIVNPDWLATLVIDTDNVANVVYDARDVNDGDPLLEWDIRLDELTVGLDKYDREARGETD